MQSIFGSDGDGTIRLRPERQSIDTRRVCRLVPIRETETVRSVGSCIEYASMPAEKTCRVTLCLRDKLPVCDGKRGMGNGPENKKEGAVAAASSCGIAIPKLLTQT